MSTTNDLYSSWIRTFSAIGILLKGTYDVQNVYVFVFTVFACTVK